MAQMHLVFWTCANWNVYDKSAVQGMNAFDMRHRTGSFNEAIVFHFIHLGDTPEPVYLLHNQGR